MSQNRQFILLGLNFAFLLSLSAYLFFASPKETTLYVDSQAVFDGFTMTKEIQRSGNAEIRTRSATVDSIQRALLLRPDDGEARRLLTIKTRELSDFEESYKIEQSDIIWKRIRAYASDFGLFKGANAIVGMQNPNGSILYCAPNQNVTKDFLIYINKRYEGRK